MSTPLITGGSSASDLYAIADPASCDAVQNTSAGIKPLPGLATSLGTDSSLPYWPWFGLSLSCASGRLLPDLYQDETRDLRGYHRGSEAPCLKVICSHQDIPCQDIICVGWLISFDAELLGESARASDIWKDIIDLVREIIITP